MVHIWMLGNGDVSTRVEAMWTHEDAEQNRKKAHHFVSTKSALNEGKESHSQGSSKPVQVASLPLSALHLLIRGNSKH